MEISGVKSKWFMVRGLMVSLMAMLVLGGCGDVAISRDAGAGSGSRSAGYGDNRRRRLRRRNPRRKKKRLRPPAAP